jgi:hypothetical protein
MAQKTQTASFDPTASNTHFNAISVEPVLIFFPAPTEVKRKQAEACSTLQLTSPFRRTASHCRKNREIIFSRREA